MRRIRCVVSSLDLGSGFRQIALAFGAVLLLTGAQCPNLTNPTTSAFTGVYGTYDYSFNWSDGPGAANQHVNSFQRYMKITNGVIRSTDGAFNGSVLNTFGNVNFTGPCPVGSGNASFTGTVSGAQGQGSYTCPSNGYTNSWHFYNGQ